MHGPTKWVAAAAVAGAALFAGAGNVSAQGGGGGGGGGGQQAPADPPVIAYRKAMMNNNAQHLGAMRAILNGDLQGKGEDLEMHAEAVANNGKMWAGIFPAGSTGPTSRAMDEIWTKSDDFAAKVKAFADATAALPGVIDKGDKAASLAALQAVQATCGGCHMPYRKPAQPTR